MMTADMDRLLTAPGRDATRWEDGADCDTEVIGVPQRTGRHGAPLPLRQPPAGRSPQGGPRRSPEPRHARRVVIGVLIGAATMLGVASLDTFAGAKVPVLGTLASLPSPTGGGGAVEVPAPPATPGSCLSWSRPDAADAAVTECEQPHLFEQAGSVQLTDQPTLPDERLWRQLVNERCTPLVKKYMNDKFDPDGRFRVGALKPSPAKWAEGDRELRCGLQSASRSGALFPLQGRATDGDQASVQQPGTCLAIDGRTIGDPIDCGGPHAVETVGIVDLSSKFADKFPVVGDQDAFLQSECAKLAEQYAGGANVVSGKKLTVYWDNTTEDSWKAGSRKVNCNLAALLPDRSGFAPVKGSVRGDVEVGDTPAPPATPTPAPEPSTDPTTEPPATTPPSEPAPVTKPPAPTKPPVPTRPETPTTPVGDQPGATPPPGTSEPGAAGDPEPAGA